MQYRITEHYYGSHIHFNDWQAEGGKLVSAGGALQIFPEQLMSVRNLRYLYGGGGDVEFAVRFNFERIEGDFEFVVHFNRRPRDAAGGFRGVMTPGRIAVLEADEELVAVDAPAWSVGQVYTLKLATLAESYQVSMDGTVLTEGRLQAPFTDNEGHLAMFLRGADVRVLAFQESFITADVEFPEWERKDLLCHEAFTSEGFGDRWVCNGVPPQLSEGACTFKHMSVNVLTQRFDGPIAIDCLATPMPAPDFTAGVTDAIFIWMIDKPEGDLFDYMRGLENASLGNYVPLPLYWVDFGGTNNVTTRLRKNPGRHMIRQFTDRPRLMERRRSYRITSVANGNTIEWWVDGERWIQAWDPNPLTGGHVGFRAFVSDLEIRDLKIWRIG